MTKTLAHFLDLTPEQVRAQWTRILRREWPGPGKRQEAFLPVEVILSYALFFVMDPHRFGGANMDRAPEVVHALASVFKRPPNSINYKMLNLDGSQKNCGKMEPELFAALAKHEDLFAYLYELIITAARDEGLGDTLVPDFLGLPTVDHRHFLLGQDELSSEELALFLEENRSNVVMLERAKGLTEQETVRVIEQRARMGQHRFAKQVVENYDHACAFCGFSTKELEGHRLLFASHIKPWRDSTNRERLDPNNGIAACPVHDSAFDTGLLMVNGGFHIHVAGKLRDRMGRDPKAGTYFGDDLLAPALIIPPGAQPPDRRYLDYHRAHIFERHAVDGAGA